MTLDPAWLPTWPSTWTDFEKAYRRTIPAEWPGNLFRVGSSALSDLRVHGHSLAQVRKLIEWMLKCIWPEHDTEGLFLDRWEDSLGIPAGLSKLAASRATWIRAILGLSVGTLTYRVACEVMKFVFWQATPDWLSVHAEHPTAAEIAARNPDAAAHRAFCQTNVHWYQDDNVAPDDRIAQWILSLITPAGAFWSYGQENHGEYSATLTTLGSAGMTYNHVTYGH